MNVTEEKPTFGNCPRCGVPLYHEVEIEEDESIIIYHTWKCPKCGYIHTEEEY